MIALLALAASACRQDMHDQAKLEPYEASKFFADGRASRPLVPGVVARGHLDVDSPFMTGRSGSAYVSALPVAVDAALLSRGQQRYNIYCSPCHDRTGSGSGMIVQRGYRHPPSFHEARLRDTEVGYLYEVITKGFGVMPAYAAQVPPHDRWAIVAYLRALQLSQHAALGDVPAAERPGLLRAQD